MKNLESCGVNVNDGVTAKQFSLYKDTRQGDLASPFIYTLALEVFFMLIKSNTAVKDLDIYDYNYLYRTYAIIAVSSLRTKNLL